MSEEKEWWWYNFTDLDDHLIWTYKKAFTDNYLRELAKKLQPYEQKLQAGKLGPKDDTLSINRDIRISEVTWLNYSDEGLFEFYKNLTLLCNDANRTNFGFSLTRIEPLQYSVYRSGDSPEENSRYEWHMDQHGPRTFRNENRKLSFSILLNEPGVDYDGGEFEIKTGPDETVIDLRKGDVIFFPSYLLHRVCPIIRGTRRSIVGWISGPNWV